MAKYASGNPWIDIFSEIQEEELGEVYGDAWTLQFNYRITNELTSEKKQQGWKVFEKPSFGSFTCSKCSHFWNSAKICIVFHYQLRQKAKRGMVLMRPFRQQCRNCQSDFFEKPKFNENRIEEILLVLIGKIRKNCYHEEDFDEPAPLVPSHRFWTKPHHKELCEACLQGICTKA